MNGSLSLIMISFHDECRPTDTVIFPNIMSQNEKKSDCPN